LPWVTVINTCVLKIEYHNLKVYLELIVEYSELVLNDIIYRHDCSMFKHLMYLGCIRKQSKQ